MFHFSISMLNIIWYVYLLLRICINQRDKLEPIVNKRPTFGVYWINLDSAVSRRNSMRNSLKLANSKRIVAVTDKEVEKEYGKSHKKISFFHHTQEHNVWMSHINNIYTYKELATCLSHIKAIKRAYDEGNTFALILEDDVIISPQFNLDIVTHVAPDNWETIQLYVHHTKMVFRNNRIIDPIVNWKVGYWGAAAYIINKKGMEKILSIVDSNTHFDLPIVVADEFVYYHTNSYTCTFPFVTTAGHKSQIQNNDINYNKINKFSKQRANGRQIVLKTMLTSKSLNVVLEVKSSKTFLQDVAYLDRWHNGEIYWNIIGECPTFLLPINTKCIQTFEELRTADYVLFKHKNIVLTGFAWQTFFTNALSATISGTLHENKQNNVLSRQSKIHNGKRVIGRFDKRSNSLFEYRTWRIGIEDVAISQNRGAFSSIAPFPVDVVQNSFALLEGNFASWFLRQFDVTTGFDYMWCGAASDWSKKTPCQIVPLAIRQTTDHIEINEVALNNDWMSYSLKFRNEYMKPRIFKHNLFDGKHSAYNTFHSFSYNYNRPVYQHATYEDTILSKKTFMSPIVVHKYKWIMFSAQKIVSSKQKKFIRGVLGCGDGGENPQQEHDGCFTFLRDYDIAEVSKMMSDSSWTKSMFIREPFEKVLSSYLFVKKYNYTDTHLGMTTKNFSQFLYEIVPQNAHDPHFEPQYQRIDEKWWPYVNFIGTMADFSNKFQELLQKLGLWEEFGKSGWGENGVQPITKNTAVHATKAAEKMNKYYTLELKKYVAKYYANDFKLYNNI